jgi:hypothetical protein
VLLQQCQLQLVLPLPQLRPPWHHCWPGSPPLLLLGLPWRPVLAVVVVWRPWLLLLLACSPEWVTPRLLQLALRQLLLVLPWPHLLLLLPYQLPCLLLLLPEVWLVPPS